MKTKKSSKLYLRIDNKGEIDVNAFKLLGATTKDGTKIGYFGSGLKYALAVLLRNGINFKVFSGEKEIKISTENTSFRGNSYKVINVDGSPTSMTTDMGRDWKTWYVIREIYCNALDEGDEMITVSDKFELKKGVTRFYIEFNDEIQQISKDWDMYFTLKRKDEVCYLSSNFYGKIKMFSSHGENVILYRKGIQVYVGEHLKSLYDYDLNDVEINEARELSNLWNAQYNIVHCLAEDASAEVIEEIFKNWNNTFEGKLNYEYCSFFNIDWLNVVDNRTIYMDDFAGHFIEEIDSNSLILPTALAKALAKCFGDKIHVRGFSSEFGDKDVRDLTTREKSIVNECVSFLKEGGLDIQDYVHTIKKCVFRNKNILGEAHEEDTILISDRCFDMGKRIVLETIVEEYCHLNSKAEDKTRRFQDFLIKLYIKTLEEKTGKNF